MSADCKGQGTGADSKRPAQQASRAVLRSKPAEQQADAAASPGLLGQPRTSRVTPRRILVSFWPSSTHHSAGASFML